MKAVILAGGKGKRLRPITDYVPKPLVPIRNVPIIEWQIRYLKKFGIREVIVCTGYKSEMIQDYIGNKRLGVRVRFSVEKKPLGTGGAIKRAARHVGTGPFLVINGDVITDIDPKKLSGPNSIAAVEVRTKFGIMDIEDGLVKRFREKKEIKGVWMNAGIYMLDAGIARDLPVTGDIEKTVFPKYARAEKLRTVMFPRARWHSIDSLKDVEQASQEIEEIIG